MEARDHVIITFFSPKSDLIFQFFLKDDLATKGPFFKERDMNSFSFD